MLEMIFEKIKEYQTIIIHRHMRPDPDALGSQVGLQRLLQKRFPEKTIKVTGYTEPNLAWLAQMDTVEDVEYQGALIIVTDTANQARIDDKRYNQGGFLIKIDHHPNDEVYGDLSWVDTDASSCSEMIAHFALEMGLEMDGDIAYALYAGIVGDTGRFLYPATSAKTFRIVAELRQYNFDFAGLSRQMDSVDDTIAKVIGYVYNHLEIDENGAARVILSQSLLKEYGISDADTSFIVGVPGRVNTVKNWGVFVEQPDGSYRVRLRSKFLPINEIAKRHHGGGHPLASGANSYSIEENEEIYKELQQVAADASR
ncbi:MULTISPECIES: bifunctional oligoribonuclease/PAP phosphatase NrnA [unclassified Streptococcus]|uniref:DHH family phosphoesterase n=1 Tax=unclassified Streptococcus TaxID=2608887 RepID=UPI001071810B|nr:MULTISPECIES: bifunctional oligoribonuclease/PAP phosphatase NrnA [unclassified Streptococcus]MBF0786536.1 bifunctional oligoribonuclease/PAP phosphatase NrnA [Streptococcus sp. 19428wC2_LYSM12]MCQ9212307.1 bifunctional oligoribonuclease/PAP phosphatase NrnA [Streptococcus sp. B01]MCQ9213638.1 bifunctional oligoribonuclease/PAP phosphatase NrnA [Streptococcus sp. O1]TFV06698.1 bifunctional oligoribonuclease/PAP phosphatase NrnA [Streptococcus sp. LYSM12]